MKNLFYILCLIFFVISCEEKKGNSIQGESNDSITVKDTTIYGTIGDETSMNVLQAITLEGDTLTYYIEDETSVVGGLFEGNRIAIIANTNEEGDNIASKIINLTTLMGTWKNTEDKMTLQENGEIEGSKIYSDWQILNGMLVLSPDTFSIYSLGADSLYLENDKGIFTFTR